MENMFMRKILMSLVMYFIIMSHSFSRTIWFGMEEVVIKKARCANFGSLLIFTISNRRNSEVSGVLKITAFDKDKDPIGNATKKFSLNGISGDQYQERINCVDGGYFKFELVR